MGGGYTMENKDTKTDYQEVFIVGDQKWEMVEIIHYFLCMYVCMEFSSPTWEKSPPPKVPIPTQNSTQNLT